MKKSLLPPGKGMFVLLAAPFIFYGFLAGAQRPSAATDEPQPEQHKPSSNSGSRLSELRDQYNRLAVRANAVDAALNSLKKDLETQGLNLRRDIREAQERMDQLLDDAFRAIRDGNADEAARSLESALPVLEIIEKFLGR
ncbi:MAG TPA: hypothetical protein VFK06_25820 [Candidatus Angelobacter sp.]|nr:hypothetical protein [Candidatus Angelobacter sp.]